MVSDVINFLRSFREQINCKTDTKALDHLDPNVYDVNTEEKLLQQNQVMNGINFEDEFDRLVDPRIEYLRSCLGHYIRIDGDLKVIEEELIRGIYGCAFYALLNILYSARNNPL